MKILIKRLEQAADAELVEGNDRVTRRRFMFAAKVVISAVLVCWIVSRSSLPEIFASLSQADLKWLALAACSPAIGIFLTATRWGGLLRAQGVILSTGMLAESCLVAGFARQFLPSTIGGDAVRGYDSWKAGASKSVALAVLLVDRLMGLFALGLFAVVAFLLSPDFAQPT